MKFPSFLAHRCKTALACLWLVLLVSLPLWSQTDSGRVVGTVIDPTGAVISGATITLTSQTSGLKRTAASNEKGEFDFEAVQRGLYSAQITAPGFQGQQQSFDLQVSQTQTLRYSLQPGAANQTVEVTDAAPVVDLSTSSTGLVIDSQQATDLPLNGRNFTSLALLTPGVTRGAYGSQASGVGGNAETFRYGETGGAALSANGLRQEANNFELDGVDNNEMLVGTIVFFPPVEATQEFRVATTLATAQYGGAGGAMVQSSIKSGSNQYHGSAFFFDRDKIFDANPNYNFQAIAGGVPAPSFHRTQFGGTLGGPIWRDRIFLFGDYQGLRQEQPQGQSFLTVPTAKMRTGDFSEFLNPALTQGNSIPGQVNSFWVPACSALPGSQSADTFGALINPLTCTQFDYNGQPNVINPAQMSQAGLNYLNAYPLPTPSLASTTVVNNYQTNPSQTQRYDDFDVRLDVNISKKDSAFARYSYGQDVLNIASQLPNLPAGFGAGYNPTHPRGVAAGETHIFSPHIVNEARFGYTRPYYAYVNPFNNVALATQLGIPGNTALEGGLGEIASGYAGSGDAGPYYVPQKTWQGVDDVSWVKGNHSFKFGADVMYHQVKYFQIPDAKGHWDFANNFTGYSGADVLAGFVNDFEAGVGVPQGFIDTRNWHQAYYGQDDWKVSRRLTLNLGLRYELFTYPIEANNNQSNFSLTTLTLLEAGKNGNSRTLVNNNYTNFGPRIGFAYDLTGKGTASLRGGYGLFYFQERAGGGNGLFSNPDFNGVQETDDYRTPQDRINLGGETPMCSVTLTMHCQSSPNYDNNAADATGTLPFPVAGTLVNINDPTGVDLISQDPRSPTSMVQEWNLQFQMQLDTHTSFSLAYVGTKADHLLTSFNLNEQENGYINGVHAAYNQFLYPQFSSIDRLINEGTANDNALEATLQRNMSKGLQITAAYTWSHALNDSEDPVGSGGSDSSIEVTNGVVNLHGKMGNYGNADEDIRQNFSFSALYLLPFGHGRQWGQHLARPLEAIAGGWQLNTIVHLQTGTPFDVTTGKGLIPGDTSNSCSCEWATPNERADLTGQIHYRKSIFEWFDFTQFSPPPATWVNGVGNGYPVFDRQGTIGRNQLYGPSLRTLDASLFKNFPIFKTVSGQIRAEAFNLTNTPQFTNPDGQVSPTYNIPVTVGTALPTQDLGYAGQINGVRLHSERQLEFAFRLIF